MGAVSGALMTTGVALAAPVDQAQSGVNKVGGTDEGNNDLLGTVRTIINVILGVVGVLAVFMMIVDVAINEHRQQHTTHRKYTRPTVFQQ